MTGSSPSPSSQLPGGAAPRSWLQSLRVYLEPASLRMLLLGMSAGLPLLLVLGTLSFRLREAGINRATISFLGWVGLAYGFKWVWAPLVDRLPIPLLTRSLGRRRSWLLVSQLFIMAGLVGMAMHSPQQGVTALARWALLVAFASATQDIALDAFRIESATADKQAVLAANYQTGYRLAMICAGAGVLSLVAWLEKRHAPVGAGYYDPAWKTAYLTMAVLMLVGVVTVLFSREPQATAPTQAALAGDDRPADPAYEQALQQVAHQGVAVAGMAAFGLCAFTVVGMVARAAKAQWWQALNQLSQGSLGWLLPILCAGLVAATALGWGPRWRPAPHSAGQKTLARVQASFVAPFVDFFARYRWQAVLILGLIGIYRISDVVMGIMANPFYVDMQFSKEQVALVSGVFGIFFTLLGTFIGGVLALRLGVMRVLMLGAILAAASNLLFAWLASHPAVAQSLWQFSMFGKSFSLPMTLTAVIAADNLSGGIASAAFIAYLSGLTSISYSATQYALFSSIMLLLPKFIAGFSGTFVNTYGYPAFFISTAVLGIPVVVLVWLAGRSLRVDGPKG
ncbi:MAG: permease [Brachymonas sp.]|nr:permease [Brachymonas sp.]